MVQTTFSGPKRYIYKFNFSYLLLLYSLAFDLNEIHLKICPCILDFCQAKIQQLGEFLFNIFKLFFYQYPYSFSKCVNNHLNF